MAGAGVRDCRTVCAVLDRRYPSLAGGMAGKSLDPVGGPSQHDSCPPGRTGCPPVSSPPADGRSCPCALSRSRRAPSRWPSLRLTPKAGSRVALRGCGSPHTQGPLQVSLSGSLDCARGACMLGQMCGCEPTSPDPALGARGPEGDPRLPGILLRSYKLPGLGPRPPREGPPLRDGVWGGPLALGSGAVPASFVAPAGHRWVTAKWPQPASLGQGSLRR